MTEEQKLTLTARLEEETKAVLRKFGILVSNVAQALEHSGVKVEALKLFFNACGIHMLADNTKPPESTLEVMNRATKEKYWTFFNYELLESMMTTLCKTGETTTCLNTYKSDFKVYCKRRLFAVPAIVADNQMPHSDEMLQFSIVLDKNFSISLEDVKNTEHFIAKLLNIRPLFLIRINAGSIEITFGCFKKFEDVFPNLIGNTTVSSELARLKITHLKCGDFELQATEIVIEQEDVKKGKLSVRTQILKSVVLIESILHDTLANVLSTKNKEDICAYLLPFSSVWYGTGIGLGVHVEKLDQIKELYEDAEDCLREMIRELEFPLASIIEGESDEFTVGESSEGTVTEVKGIVHVLMLLHITSTSLSDNTEHLHEEVLCKVDDTSQSDEENYDDSVFTSTGSNLF